MNSEQYYQGIDYRKVFKEIMKRKKIYFIVIPIVFVLSCIYTLSIPRSYTTDTELVPEVETKASSSGTLGSLASTFGIDLSAAESSDAISPQLYPDLMFDNGFVSQLFPIKVESQDGKIKTDYYTYLAKYQKNPWWDKTIDKIKKAIGPSKVNAPISKEGNPYILSKKDYDIVKNIQESITIKVDKKTGAITIDATAQDPMVCKILADSTRVHLQNFITKYRTSKSIKEYKYYKKLTENAKAAYEKQRRKYGESADANTDVALESFRLEQEDLENEMQLLYNTYTTLNAQLQAATAKVQQSTPVFMLIKGAAVPVKPSAPKRMLFVLAMVLLAFMLTSIYVLRDIILPPSELSEKKEDD